MKKIHLLCNAHIDPVWLWRKEDGIAETVSTFRVAADFCENYDGFVFNHNESCLYEWVEEYEPELFERIKRLVAEGKWHIMGGWYLQPDCVLPSGEGLLRQIEVGNSYFAEKFGIKTTTAINFDPFGHTRGLVQILKKCGYDSYIVTRPRELFPERDFIWRGFDGSEIIAHRTPGSYRTLKGQALAKLEKEAEVAREGANLMTWGIGNHGGGPSKIDLDAINKFIEENKDLCIVHSTPEDYFAEINKDELPVIDTSLVHCMMGCYTTMASVKQTYRALENELVLTEKMLSASGIDYDKEQFMDAQKSMLFCQFHDVLPGTMIKKCEEDALREMNHAREILSRFRMKAFMKMCEGQAKGKSGEIPVLVFNPNPYRISQEIEIEFLLENQNWTEHEVTVAKVRDKNGSYLPVQNEKEASSMNLDWVKRIAFMAELEPMSVNRFDLELERVKSDRRPILPCEEKDNCFVVSSDRMTVEIDKSTGRINRYAVDGVELLKAGSARIGVYRDNEDPWGMKFDGFYDRMGEFCALSDEKANRFNGYPDEKISNVRIIENGEMRTKIQAILKSENSFAILTYSIPKKGAYIDLSIKMLSNDPNRMYKLELDTTLGDARFVGQTAFGREDMFKNGQEVVAQKWCALENNGHAVAVMNRGNYGTSSVEGLLTVSLLRTPVYSAHPIAERLLCDRDMNHDHIDMGERHFELRITPDLATIDRDAEIYNQQPYILSFFPSGNGEKKDTAIEIESSDVILSAYKPIDEVSRFIRLFNSHSENVKTRISIEGKSYNILLTPFEIKGFVLKNGELTEGGIIL